MICVDLPPEEDDALGPALRAKGIAPIRLATPTSDAARLPAILEGSAGFLYYVSVAGITGKQQAAQASIDEAYYGPLEPGDARTIVEQLRAGSEPVPEKNLRRRPMAGGPDGNEGMTRELL